MEEFRRADTLTDDERPPEQGPSEEVDSASTVPEVDQEPAVADEVRSPPPAPPVRHAGPTRSDSPLAEPNPDVDSLGQDSRDAPLEAGNLSSEPTGARDGQRAAPEPAGGALGPAFGDGYYLASGCQTLDELLGGGLEPDAVTLIFGEAGSGKTNFAIQCARQATLDGRVAYVDTEGLSPVRLGQVFAAGGDIERLARFTPYDFAQQEKMVERATLLPDLRLVVVDSINIHYRLQMDGGEGERGASRSMLKQLHHLMGFARRAQVPVLITGQVYDGEDGTLPFARRTMEHLAKAMVRFEKRPDGRRMATILKHRSMPDGRRARFTIVDDGLRP